MSQIELANLSQIGNGESNGCSSSQINCKKDSNLIWNDESYLIRIA